MDIMSQLLRSLRKIPKHHFNWGGGIECQIRISKSDQTKIYWFWRRGEKGGEERSEFLIF